MFRLARAFPAVIYVTKTIIIVWLLLDCRVTKGSGEPVQPCEDLSDPSLLV